MRIKVTRSSSEYSDASSSSQVEIKEPPKGIVVVDGVSTAAAVSTSTQPGMEETAPTTRASFARRTPPARSKSSDSSSPTAVKAEIARLHAEGLRHMSIGAYPPAEESFRKIVHLFRVAFGEERSLVVFDAARATLNLALVLKQQERYAEALQLLQRLDTERREGALWSALLEAELTQQLQEVSPLAVQPTVVNVKEQLSVLNARGRKLIAKGQMPKAEACFRQALRLSRQLHGEKDMLQSLDAARAVLFLTVCLMQRDAHKEALGWLKRLESDAVKGPQWSGVIELDLTQSVLNTYLALGQYDRALPYAKLLVKQSWGTRNPEETIESMKKLSLVFLRLDRAEEAQAVRKDAYFIASKKLGKKHAMTQALKNELKL